MGDRATCALLLPQHPDASRQPVYIYTHWHGAELPQRVAQGLHNGRPRWGEPSYMAAILIRAIIGDDWPEHDGWGIGHIPYGHPADNHRPLLAVDLTRRRVGHINWNEPIDLGVQGLDYDAYIGLARWPQNTDTDGIRR